MAPMQRGIDTCRPGAERGSEMARKCWVDTLDAHEDITYTGADRLARTLRLDAASAVAATKARTSRKREASCDRGREVLTCLFDASQSRGEETEVMVHRAVVGRAAADHHVQAGVRFQVSVDPVRLRF